MPDPVFVEYLDVHPVPSEIASGSTSGIPVMCLFMDHGAASLSLCNSLRQVVLRSSASVTGL